MSAPMKVYSVRHLKRDLGSGAPGHAYAYELAARGELKLTKLGGKTVVTEADWHDYVRRNSTPYEPRSAS